MKLGSQTGSVINHLQSRAVIGQPEPKPGMGCTILKWSDRGAATIFRVFQVGKATIIETRDDHARVIAGSGHDGSAENKHKVISDIVSRGEYRAWVQPVGSRA
jgi:hypothetical protein